MEKIKKTFHEQIAENLIEQLKKGTAPWQKPWQPGDPLLTLPNNPTTGKNYKGINVLQLMCQGRTDPRWLTYKQAVNFGAQVRKGEKSTLVQHWKFADERIKKDDNGNPVLDSEGRQIKEQVKLERPRVFYASVFNAEQIDNLPKLEIKAPDWEPLDRAEQILQQSNAAIHHGENDRAFYRPSTDSIHLPHKHQFSAPEHYYATALHELGHWSGSETRLNRDLSHPFGSEGYAKEELRAEIASMLLGGELGIGHDPEQHAAYVGSWIKVLEEDPKEIFRAAADAEKIKDYVLSFSQQQEIVDQEEITMDQTSQQNNDADSRKYLFVPYAEKDLAKAAGACWDNTAKAWYVGPEADIRTLQRWLPENVSGQQDPAMSPEAEFADLLRSHGCVVDDNHPLMDGSKHRVKVIGDKPGEKSGFYVVHMDGHPAGYFNNHRTKAEIRWKAKGYSLTEAQKAAFAAQVAIKQQERKAEQHAQHAKVAQAIKELLAIAPSANADHPYLQDKNARPNGLKVVPQITDGLPQDSMIRICQKRQEVKTVRDEHPDSLVFVAGDLLLPIYDANGNIWSAQTIQPNGTKLFVAGSHKEGHFHVVDGNNQELVGLPVLDNTKAIIIAEGYSTADTVSQVMNCPVVAAFDSGNLIPVAKLLHEKYPNKPIIIAGDDDQHLVVLNGKNTGRDKAQEAAQLVNGVAVFPVFAPNEQVSQKLSDFNDLAN
ncbi:DUF1738 domain-containing protein, partial [Betaproteobacteria bacterium PRO4]|nr:DUF1738 domain-containing protein [Betaproteobacteria bacterium PRO4]